VWWRCNFHHGDALCNTTAEKNSAENDGTQNYFQESKSELLGGKGGQIACPFMPPHYHDTSYMETSCFAFLLGSRTLHDDSKLLCHTGT
jgi:hypothetical protein